MVGPLLPPPPNSRAGMRVGQQPAYLKCRALGPGCSEGWGLRDLLLVEPVGRVWGPGPTPSLSSLMPAAADRCQIPVPASPDPGVGPKPPRPALPFRVHLVAPPAGIRSPPGSAKSPKVKRRTLGSGKPRTQRGELERRRGGEARKVGVQFIDMRSRELGGRAEGGRGRRQDSPSLGPPASSWRRLRALATL